MAAPAILKIRAPFHFGFTTLVNRFSNITAEFFRSVEIENRWSSVCHLRAEVESRNSDKNRGA
jgi:hypothetical protein